MSPEPAPDHLGGAVAFRDVTALSTEVRALTEVDRPGVEPLLAADPVASCAVASRVESAPLDALGGTLWGVGERDGLRALCFAGGTLLPVAGSAGDLRGVAAALAERERACSSIVGRAEHVLAMWPVLQEAWGPARDVRGDQPLMVTTSASPVDFDPAVHRVALDQVEQYLPAAQAMFREELGVRAPVDTPASPYRQRVTALIDAGLAFARVDADGAVVFKAEIAVVSSRCCQVQGVWVDPRHRGRGVATAGMAAVVRFGLQLTPAVSLYVNSFNQPARSLYHRLGFRQVATFATVLY